MAALIQQSLFADDAAAVSPGVEAESLSAVMARAEAMAATGDIDAAVGLFEFVAPAALAAFADEWGLYPCNSGDGRAASLQRIRNHLYQRTPDAASKRAALDRWNALQRRANVILRCARHAVGGGMWPWADAGMLDRVHVPHSGLMPPTLDEVSRGWGFDRATCELQSICDEVDRDFPRNAATHYLTAKIREAMADGFSGAGSIASRERFLTGLHYDDSIAQDRSVQALAEDIWRTCIG
jgi:hypothetical protein